MFHVNRDKTCQHEIHPVTPVALRLNNRSAPTPMFTDTVYNKFHRSFVYVFSAPPFSGRLKRGMHWSSLGSLTAPLGFYLKKNQPFNLRNI